MSGGMNIKESTNSRDTTIYNSLGWLYLTNGDYKEAETYLKQAAAHEAENDPAENRRIFNNLGILYLYTGDYAQSHTYLEKSEDLNRSGATSNLAALLQSVRTSQRKDTNAHAATTATHN